MALGAVPHFEIAAYFSMVTYRTVGYGDVVLPTGWYILAGMDGRTGILMAGWSTAFLFAVAMRLIAHAEPDHRAPGGPVA